MPSNKAPGIDWVKGWVSLKADLESGEKEVISLFCRGSSFNNRNTSGRETKFQTHLEVRYSAMAKNGAASCKTVSGYTAKYLPELTVSLLGMLWQLLKFASYKYGHWEARIKQPALRITLRPIYGE